MKTKIGALARLCDKHRAFRSPSAHKRLAGRAYTGAHGLAVGGEALYDLADERLVDLLSYESIEFDLIIIHEDQRALVVRRWADPAFLRHGRHDGDGSSRAEHRAPGDFSAP